MRDHISKSEKHVLNATSSMLSNQDNSSSISMPSNAPILTSEGIETSPPVLCGTIGDYNMGIGNHMLISKLRRKRKNGRGRMLFIPKDIRDDSSNDCTFDHKNVTIIINNLTHNHQLDILQSMLGPERGIVSWKHHFDEPDPNRRQRIDISYDPIVVSCKRIVDSLVAVELNCNIENAPNPLADDDAVSSVCRSSLYVEGICCATEVPIVTHILLSSNKKFIKSVRINITSRMVYVDHDAKQVSAVDLVNFLKQEGFEAVVKKDGSTQFHDRTIATSGLNYVESTLKTPSLETTEDLDYVTQVLEEHDYLYEKIRFVFPNISSRTIKIEHNPLLVSAQNVANFLMDVGGYSNVSVLIDGDKEHLNLPPMIRGKGLNSFGVPTCYSGSHFLCLKGLKMNVIFSGIFWVMSIIGALSQRLNELRYAGLLSVIFGLPPVAIKAFNTARRLHFDANCMMLIAAIGALALQEYDEAASVSFLFAISEFLENQATMRARKALDTIVNLRPDHANLIDDASGHVTIIPSDTLEIGSLVSVRTGDKVPSDGIVVEGESHVDESSLTGESIHVLKEKGSSVSGGTINVGSKRLIVRITTRVENSAVSRLIRLVEDSTSNRSPTEQIVDQFARTYTPVVLVFAAIMCTFPWLFGAEIGRRWTLNGLIIVVIACPCALTISTPVTYAAGLAATAQKGIIVKGGARLEALGSIKTVVFDKTGTLTEGKFRLLHLDVIGKWKTRDEVLEILASVESHSSHPLAATLVDAAKQEGVFSSASIVTDHTVLKGEGIVAKVEGVRTYVGNSRLFQRINLFSSLNSTDKEKALAWSEKGGTVGFLGIHDVGIIAMYCVADKVREEAGQVVESLLNDDINVFMLTGDANGSANTVAKELGLPQENVRSSFLPEDKLHFVANLLGFSKRKSSAWTKRELLLFCGDGINDAPALSIADVGVAMGEGASLAMEMSDVTLMDSNLTKLLFSMTIGMKVIATVHENIAISVAVKVVVIALTFAGRMTLLGAIASDVGVMLLVSINGMKLLPRTSELCCRKRRQYHKVPIKLDHVSELV